MEGFNLSLMEAISHGMVRVTYDVNYGPNELIVDGENGFVVPYEGIQEMADRLVELFTQEDKLQKCLLSLMNYLDVILKKMCGKLGKLSLTMQTKEYCLSFTDYRGNRGSKDLLYKKI